ncbi:MAG: hypothetical protein ACRDY0_06630 [Acidimicrobiales bacterium]
MRTTIAETVELERRQEHRGRPGSNTRFRRVERHRFSISVDTDAVA